MAEGSIIVTVDVRDLPQVERMHAELLWLRAECSSLKERKDAAYLERNGCVALIARMAKSMGMKVGLRRSNIEGWGEEWHGCVYIDLPTGQVSWHYHDSHAHLFEGLPAYDTPYDGHTTPEKYERVWQAFRE